jgi:hypothetical protein
MKTTAELTALGIEYVDLAEGIEKQDKLLEILQCFHNYLLKYVSMIVAGHLPLTRKGGRKNEINQDTHLLLCYFIARGQPVNHATLGQACRTLHLAFKGMDADEVYDPLMMCLVKAIKKYDPYYSDKGKAGRSAGEARHAEAGMLGAMLPLRGGMSGRRSPPFGAFSTVFGFPRKGWPARVC